MPNIGLLFNGSEPENTRRWREDFLAAKGYDVYSATRLDTLVKSGLGRLDAVLTEPYLSGLELGQHIGRLRQAQHNIPVIVVSRTRNFQSAAHRAGAVECLELLGERPLDERIFDILARRAPGVKGSGTVQPGCIWRCDENRLRLEERKTGKGEPCTVALLYDGGPDADLLRRAHEQYVARLGYNVYSCCTLEALTEKKPADAALEALGFAPVEMVVTAACLRGMEPAEHVRALRKFYPRLPIAIAATADDYKGAADALPGLSLDFLLLTNGPGFTEVVDHTLRHHVPVDWGAGPVPKGKIYLGEQRTYYVEPVYAAPEKAGPPAPPSAGASSSAARSAAAGISRNNAAMSLLAARWRKRNEAGGEEETPAAPPEAEARDGAQPSAAFSRAIGDAARRKLALRRLGGHRPVG